MATVEQIYEIVCLDLMEDGGLVLGLITEQQILDVLNLAIIEFLQKSGMFKEIATQPIMAGVSQYIVPEDMMRVDEVFIGGVLAERSNVPALNNAIRKWRSQLDVPRFWHEDQLPIQTVEVAPLPNYNSPDFLVDLSTPPPPVQYGSFSVTLSDATTADPATHLGLTFVGLEKPDLVTGLSDLIPMIPDDWALAYLPYGRLKRIFSSDSELRDEQRSLWASVQFDEGIAAAQAIMSEVSDEEMA